MSSFFSLLDCEIGKKYIINFIEDDCSSIMRRLGELGFSIGAEVVLLRKSMLGYSVLISLNSNKMVLRNSLADKIIIKEII